MYPTLFNTMNYSPPGSSVHEILQARILEWVAISFSRGCFQPSDWTWVSRNAGRFFTIWAPREALWGNGVILPDHGFVFRGLCVFLLFASPASSGRLGLESENLESSGVWSLWRKALQSDRPGQILVLSLSSHVTLSKWPHISTFQFPCCESGDDIIPDLKSLQLAQCLTAGTQHLLTIFFIISSVNIWGWRLLSFYQTGNPLRKHILCLILLYSQYGDEPYPYVSMFCLHSYWAWKVLLSACYKWGHRRAVSGLFSVTLKLVSKAGQNLVCMMPSRGF